MKKCQLTLDTYDFIIVLERMGKIEYHNPVWQVSFHLHVLGIGG